MCHRCDYIRYRRYLRPWWQRRSTMCLRDDGIAYAEKLGAAGVAVTHMHAPDMHHNFPVHPATVARFPQSDAALSRIAGWLRATLAAAT